MIDDLTGKICQKELEGDGAPVGKTRNLNAIGAIGIFLICYHTRGSCARSLALLFGKTLTPMYKWLNFARKELLHVLSRDINAMVKIPPFMISGFIRKP